MKNYDLNEKIIFSDEKPIKRHFLNPKGFHAALICLKLGVGGDTASPRRLWSAFNCS